MTQQSLYMTQQKFQLVTRIRGIKTTNSLFDKNQWSVYMTQKRLYMTGQN